MRFSALAIAPFLWSCSAEAQDAQGDKGRSAIEGVVEPDAAANAARYDSMEAVIFDKAAEDAGLVNEGETAPLPQSSKHPDVDRQIDEILSRPASPTVGEVLYKGLQGLHGGPLKRAFAVLGHPDKQMTIAEGLVYSWFNTAPGELRCTVKVVAKAGRVLTTDFAGNNGACTRFARAVDPSYIAR